ncbi:SAM-dependent methyltransferase [Actinomadura rudentiformis]|uniref:SAM-dependent methyltransferase n=1 Tax=Actinomadura rudentiformis TaxID=359158 RepID=A0A6H9YP50_9ACTN|nr:SAM-dependent methyltransferase [Actinomadura rudentiformis]KAB2345217.1 SAM-dependent methyltransferase [Actinomadura rudentiformis]
MSDRDPLKDLGFDGPASARVYDYSLGGKDNYAPDRSAASDALDAYSVARLLPRENRKFMRRAVRYLLATGVRQFIDIGCGLPGKGNVHDLALGADPDAKVVYVDNDPVAVVHFQALGATAINADARHPETILGHPELTALIDFDRPVGILMISMLDWIPDEDDPDTVVAAFREALSPGGHLVICDFLSDNLSDADRATHRELTERYGISLTFRSSERFKGFFDGLDLVEPGLVLAPEWRPDRPYDPPSGWLLAGVGRKP